MSNDSSNLIPAILRSAEILELISRSDDGIQATDIVKQVNIPPSTTYRIIKSLMAVHFIEYDSKSRNYFTGELFQTNKEEPSAEAQILTVAPPFVDNLAEKISETAKLSIRVGLEVEIKYVASSGSGYRIAVDEGTRFPLHTGAASKLLLSFLPTHVQEMVLSNHLERYTKNTITDVSALRFTLEEIRRNNYSWDNQEYVDGIEAVAFPIINHRHYVVAALSVPFFAAHGSGSTKRTKIMPNIKRTAIQISRVLGASIADNSYPILKIDDTPTLI